MSFHLSAENIWTEGATLKARLRNTDGDWVDTQINLNDFLGNNNGRFEWDGNNFAESAENIRFAIEGGGEVPVLRASLRALDGSWHEADVNLSERVINKNGHFEFV